MTHHPDDTLSPAGREALHQAFDAVMADTKGLYVQNMHLRALVRVAQPVVPKSRTEWHQQATEALGEAVQA